MAIKYLRSLRTEERPKTTRPIGLRFPIGLDIDSPLQRANSADSVTQQTFDILLVAGGGNGGPKCGPVRPGAQDAGGGGAGGVRLFSANNFSELPEYKNFLNFSETCNVLPVVVGGAGGNSCFSAFINCRGGAGGVGGWSAPAFQGGGGGTPGGPGGSGGGAGRGAGDAGANFPFAGGSGIVGQGCCGACGLSQPGGSATASGSTTGGLTTSFTGTSVRYGDGGQGASNINAVANRGNAGGGGCTAYGQGLAGSGLVAIRYRNPAAPTTPLAIGGDCVCCTGGCIIHIYNSSGFLNVDSVFSIN